MYLSDVFLYMKGCYIIRLLVFTLLNNYSPHATVISANSHLDELF